MHTGHGLPRHRSFELAESHNIDVTSFVPCFPLACPAPQHDACEKKRPRRSARGKVPKRKGCWLDEVPPFHRICWMEWGPKLCSAFEVLRSSPPSLPRVLITDRSPTANAACHSSDSGAHTSDSDSRVAAFALQSRQAACYQSHRPGGLLAERFLGGAVLGLPLSTLGALGRPSTRYAPLCVPPRRDTTNRVDERFRSASRY